MQPSEFNVSGPDSVELARTLNEIGVLQYLQNNASLVLELACLAHLLLLLAVFRCGDEFMSSHF